MVLIPRDTLLCPQLTFDPLMDLFILGCEKIGVDRGTLQNKKHSWKAGGFDKVNVPAYKVPSNMWPRTNL
jgi:hypothetical protein